MIELSTWDIDNCLKSKGRHHHIFFRPRHKWRRKLTLFLPITFTPLFRPGVASVFFKPYNTFFFKFRQRHVLILFKCICVKKEKKLVWFVWRIVKQKIQWTVLCLLYLHYRCYLKKTEQDILNHYKRHDVV